MSVFPIRWLTRILRGPAVKDLIQLLVSHKVILTSTLAVFAGSGTLDTANRPEVLAAMAPDTREMYLKHYTMFRSSAMNNAFAKDIKMEKMFLLTQAGC